MKIAKNSLLATSGLTGLLSATLLTSALASVGCGGPKAVRGSDVAGLDDGAMSTGLDRRDLQQMLKTNLDNLETSAAVRKWEAEERPTVAVLSITNETSEHIDSALEALLSDIETALVNAGHVRVISAADQPELIAQVRSQQSDAFNAENVAAWGQQVGARYFVTGKVYTVDERQDGERRVQYFLFMRVLEAATGDLLWQNKSSVTKALVK
jgi:penicillin-binding protein activator